MADLGSLPAGWGAISAVLIVLLNFAAAVTKMHEFFFLVRTCSMSCTERVLSETHRRVRRPGDSRSIALPFYYLLLSSAARLCRWCLEQSCCLHLCVRFLLVASGSNTPTCSPPTFFLSQMASFFSVSTLPFTTSPYRLVSLGPVAFVVVRAANRTFCLP